MQKYILSLLSFLARRILSIHNPKIIGITGTVGKTTITGYTTRLLRAHYGHDSVGASAYHYNGEYGLPLTIIGAKTGGKNPLLWMWVICVAIYRIMRPYPAYLVLEYGIDHPGEMDFLLSIAVPDTAIIARIAPNHLEQFGSLDRYRAEKLKITKNPTTTIIAHDSLREFLGERDALYYGKEDFSLARVIRALERVDGLALDVSYDGREHHLEVPVFGSYQAENILPLFLLSDSFDIPASEIEKLTVTLIPEAGRSRILEGISGSTIIDGSYNGGYESIIEGLRSLISFRHTHRIIILLGDMRELGEHAPDLHREIALYVLEHFANKDIDVTLYLVGPLSALYVYPVVQPKMSVIHTLSSRDAGKMIRERIMSEIKPTLIYAKGSQNTIFLEEGIKEFMAHPEQSDELTRQSPAWKKKKDQFFASLQKNPK